MEFMYTCNSTQKSYDDDKYDVLEESVFAKVMEVRYSMGPTCACIWVHTSFEYRIQLNDCQRLSLSFHF